MSSFLAAWREDPGTGTDSVAAGDALTFTNGASVGTAFSPFTAPSDTITILETGFYQVTFTVHNQGNAQGFDLELNGTPVTAVPFTGDGGGPVSAEIIIEVTTTPSTLQIVNNDNVAVNLHSDTNATITVLKLG